MDKKHKAITSLILLVPAPSLGALCGMVLFPNTGIGAGIFAFSKVWLFALPVIWYLFIEKGTFSLSPARKGGFGFGLLSGCAITAIIVGFYFLLGGYFLDKAFLVEKMNDIGLSVPHRYILGALYWICINSVLEEYVWRWFVVAQCEKIFRPWIAVVASAVFFTIHHIVAMKVYMPWTATIVCSAGIFIGGALWSWMYTKYESIWPGYLSHAIVDLCIFGIGAAMIFG